MTTTTASSFQLPYLQTDPAKRHFFARVYDRAGNSSLAIQQPHAEQYVSAITIDSFTVTPSSVPLPGGPVTISWAVEAPGGEHRHGCRRDPGDRPDARGEQRIARRQRRANTTFTLSATHPTRNPKSATASVALGADTTAPTFRSAPVRRAVVAPGSTLLAATASDAVGVTKVEFFRGATLIGTDTTAPYEQAVAFTPADIGSVAFTAKAYDAAGNITTSTV